LKTYGEIMKEILIEQGKISSNYFNINDIYDCYHRKTKKRIALDRNPRRIIDAVLSGLDRSPIFKEIKIEDNGRQIRFYYLLS